MRVLADSTEPLSSSAASNRAAPFGLSAPLVRIRPNGIQLAVSGRSLLRRPDLRAIRHAGGHSVVFVLGDAIDSGRRGAVARASATATAASSGWVEITGDGHPRNNDEVLFRLVQLRLELFRTGLEVFEAVSDELHARTTSTGVPNSSAFPASRKSCIAAYSGRPRIARLIAPKK